ncbi:MAG: hypothetical protein HGA44_20345 [Cellulomonadaceae bacterium]|nr:hypothetical protein [Cellulomonadaceae bacterium]
MEQFATAARWFGAMTPPRALLFIDELGTVTLTGLRWRGDAGARCGTGRLGASVAVFGQPRLLKGEYRIREMRSSIDGLDGFAGFRPVNYEFPGRGEPAVIALDDSAKVKWRSNGFTYTLGAEASWSGRSGTSFAATAVPYISTHRARGATPAEHLRAQWAIRDLLLFAHGRKLAWRSHRVIDDQFPLFTLDGATHGPDPAETHFSGTVSEHALPEPSSVSLAFPALQLAALGSTGLKRWTDLYADERFRRAAQPVAEVINGAATFIEPQLMMLAAALDYFGYYRYADRKSRPMQASILKCLDSADLDWPTIGTRAGIARAISNVNNDLKHPDRERRPDSDALRGVTALARVIARAQVFDLLGVDTDARTAFLRSIDGRWPTDTLNSSGLTITDGGKFVRNA